MTEEQVKHLNELVAKTTKRAESFAMMLNHVANIDNPLIVETGCARQEDNFEGDGMSTTIFDTFVDSSPGEWIQTSYNTHGGQHPEDRPLRKNYAGVGYTYDSERDAFLPPKLFDSWTLNEDTCLWEVPPEEITIDLSTGSDTVTGSATPTV